MFALRVSEHMTIPRGRRPDISKRNIRRKLKRRRQPYWETLQIGRALGYERNAITHTTYWCARYVRTDGAYRHHRLGETNDNRAADGIRVLNHNQAVEAEGLYLSTVTLTRSRIAA